MCLKDNSLILWFSAIPDIPKTTEKKQPPPSPSTPSKIPRPVDFHGFSKLTSRPGKSVLSSHVKLRPEIVEHLSDLDHDYISSSKSSRQAFNPVGWLVVLG